MHGLMVNKMMVSVIISTYGMERIKDTFQSIDSIIQQLDDESELLVVIDENPELVSTLDNKYKKQIKIIVSKEKGLSNARNTGTSNSAGDIIAFIDDDATACSGWIKAIRETMKNNPKAGAVTGKILPDWVGKDGAWFPGPLYWTISCSYMETEDGAEVESAIGTNMAFRKDLLIKEGGFPNELGAIQKWKKEKGTWVQRCGLVGEERDVCIRLLASGHRIIHSDRMCVNHKVYPYRLTMKNLIKRGYWEGVSKALFSKKYDGESLGTEKKYVLYTLKNMASKNKKCKMLCKLRYYSTLALVTCSVLFGYVAQSAGITKIS